jgi:hypothetical protein
MVYTIKRIQRRVKCGSIAGRQGGERGKKLSVEDIQLNFWKSVKNIKRF